MPITPNRFEAKSNEEYLIAVQFLKEIARHPLSQPILPFSAIRPVFEQAIHDGLIRDVRSVTLGYMAFSNPSKSTKTFYLVPVWVLEGQIMKQSSDEQQRDYYDNYPALNWQVYRKNMTTNQMVINAFTGEVINQLSTDASRLIFDDRYIR